MKQFAVVLATLVILPNSAHAQVSLDMSTGAPVLRATIAGIPVSASIGGPRGVEIRVDDRTTSPTTARRTSTHPRRTSATAASILGTADEYVGTKYVWGGSTPSGFDCSGFVQYVFREHGIELPRTSRQQAQVGEVIPLGLDALQPGDLMFFATDGARIDHIAIYVGGNEIIHSSSSGGGVGYDTFSSKRGRWFVDHHVATRRVIDDGYSLVGQLTEALRAFHQFDPPDNAPRR
jgi:cell wall-associated NlpC family hydrolase